MKRFNLIFLGIVAVVCLIFSSFSTNTEAIDAVKLAVEELVNAEEMKQAQVSFTLLDHSGNPIIEVNSHKCLAPASNVKAITTAAGIDLLGADFKYETLLTYSGNISSGVLNGDLIIKGSGDPTLGSVRITGNPGAIDLFGIWASELKKLGIKKIKGDIIADPGNYHINSIPDGWVWTDIGNYFGAGSGGLNFNENLYKLYFKPGKVGEEALVLRTEPSVPYLNFINEMKTGEPGSGDNGYIYGGIFSDLKYLRGTIPAGVSEFSIKGSIPDPAFYTAFAFSEYLKKEGIIVSGKAVNLQRDQGERAQKELSVLYSHKSPELKEIVKETNLKSINLYAEAILNTLGYKFKNKGSTKAGLEVVQEWLEKHEINTHELFLYDGSGLSPGNAVSSGAFARLMNSLKSTDSFVSSLPVAGQNGTLSFFCKNTKAEGKVYAKSGSFKGVMGYSGYIKSKNGQLLPFSILINNYQGSSYHVRKKIEKIFVAATEI